MGQKTIGIGEWWFSDDQADVITTYALGSCVALIVYSQKRRMGAMAHIALPDSSVDPSKRETLPAYFVDVAVPLVLQSFEKRGVGGMDLEIKLVGGAQLLDSQGIFDIGKRNVLAIKKLLWQHMLVVKAEDVGGNISRTVSLVIDGGKVLISSQNNKYEI